MSAALSLPAPPASVDRVEAASFVLSLRAKGISDLAVLRAMETVPRELFAPRRYHDLSRADVALPLACGQTMTAPGTVATMLAALGVQPGHRVLEVGTGSGYVAALLARLGAVVDSLERRPVLAEAADARLRIAGLAGAVAVLCADPFVTLDAAARYDRILLNGAVPALGPALTGRLAAGGRLVAAQSRPGLPALLVLSRDVDGQLVARIGAGLRIAALEIPVDVKADADPETQV